jgi:AAA15 family ATPase/GTPase
MILELKIKNFLSFKEEVTFSFEATRDKSFEDCQVVEVAPNIRVLRLAIVYGANASGKSNLLAAFEFLRNFWFNITESKDKETQVIPFLLDKDTPTQPSEFSLIFYVEGVKYSYFLELEQRKVISERLYIYPGTQPALIFERKLNGNISKIMFNSKRIKISPTVLDEITVKCLANMSVFSAYNQVNVAIPDVDKVIKWMKVQFMPSIEPNTELISYAENQIYKNQNSKDYILDFLHKADYNITNVNTERMNEDVPEKLKKTEFEHRIFNQEGSPEFYKLPKRLQSEGTLRTFGLSTVIRKTIEKNAFLTVDEIESSLHPKLVEFIIEDFLKQKGESQLLLTTHYDGLLEEDDLLRKDSIWFTNKREDGSTEIYSLADFKGVKRISSLQKAYKYGKFGAIPNI